MDPIENLILSTVAITLFETLNFLYSLFNFLILIPIFGMEGIFFSTEVSNFLIGLSNQIAAILLPFYIIIIVFYILMYIIYLIIITIIPETGFKTFFIPIRDILLKIPPLPSLIKFGVFDLIDKIIKSFGLSGFANKTIVIIGGIFDFSRENIKRVLELFIPGIGEKLENYSKEKEKFMNNEKKEIYDKIEEDKNICIAQNKIIITPNMSASEKIKTDFSNMFETINCESKSISNYIRSNK